MITIKSILKNISVKTEYIEKSDCTSGDHFKVTLKRKDNNKKIKFDFFGAYGVTGDKDLYLECLMMDRSCYLSERSFESFKEAFGYEDEKQAKDAYLGCKAESAMLSSFFTRRELEVLSSWYL